MLKSSSRIIMYQSSQLRLEVEQKTVFKPGKTLKLIIKKHHVHFQELKDYLKDEKKFFNKSKIKMMKLIMKTHFLLKLIDNICLQLILMMRASKAIQKILIREIHKYYQIVIVPNTNKLLRTNNLIQIYENKNKIFLETKFIAF